MTRTELITDAADLRGLEPAWADLFAACPDATPFSSPAWLLPWWETFSPGELHSVAVWDGAYLIALAPLYIEDGAWGRRLLPLGIGLSDHTDVLVPPDREEAAWSAIFDVLGETGSHWDIWSAEEAAPDAAVLCASLPRHWSSDAAPQSACPVLSLPHDDGLAAVPAGMLRKLRMAQHRSARRTARLVEADSSSAPTLLADLVRLHGARWATRGETGVLADDRVSRFHAQAMPALLRAGLLDLTGLEIDGVTAGVIYGFRRGTRRFAYLQGFDPAFAFESPGTVLVGASLERAGHEHATEFHFLRGQEPYKYRWGALDRWNSRRTFRRTP